MFSEGVKRVASKEETITVSNFQIRRQLRSELALSEETTDIVVRM